MTPGSIPTKKKTGPLHGVYTRAQARARSISEIHSGDAPNNDARTRKRTTKMVYVHHPTLLRLERKARLGEEGKRGPMKRLTDKDSGQMAISDGTGTTFIIHQLQYALANKTNPGCVLHRIAYRLGLVHRNGDGARRP
jgi:hypothetical protein